MTYCPAKDTTTSNIKRAKEKARKNKATSKGYRTSKSRNQYTVGVCLKSDCINRDKACGECYALNRYEVV